MPKIKYVPVVVSEDDHDWVVQCQGAGCERTIGVQKSLYSEPQPRGCIDHPPIYWVTQHTTSARRTPNA